MIGIGACTSEWVRLHSESQVVQPIHLNTTHTAASAEGQAVCKTLAHSRRTWLLLHCQTNTADHTLPSHSGFFSPSCRTPSPWLTEAGPSPLDCFRVILDAIHYLLPQCHRSSHTQVAARPVRVRSRVVRREVPLPDIQLSCWEQRRLSRWLRLRPMCRSFINTRDCRTRMFATK